MNRQQLELIVAALMFLSGIAVIVYDRIKYHKYYAKKDTFIFLRINNPEVRKSLMSAGIHLCPCSKEFRNIYLYTSDGSIVCGFSENHQHLIANAVKEHMKIIDCGIDVNKFIQKVKNYDRAE